MANIPWRDLMIFGGMFVSFGAAQTQIANDSRRLDHIEAIGTPPMAESKAAVMELSRKLDRLEILAEKLRDNLIVDELRLALIEQQLRRPSDIDNEIWKQRTH